MDNEEIQKIKEPILKRIGRALRKAAAVLGLSSKPKIRGDLKESNSILKRFGKVLKKAVAIAGIVGVFVFGGLAIKGGIDNQQYIDTATIEMNMEEFGVEDAYLMKGIVSNSYRRLANNGDEPIYVSFDNDFKSDEILAGAAIDSLDYLFGVVGEINSSYEYKLVSKAEAKKQDLLGKSVIYFQLDTNMEDSTFGKNEMNLDIQDLAYWDLINTSNNVLVNKNLYEKYKELAYNARDGEMAEEALSNISTNLLTHELLHVFGFNDVYDIGSKPHELLFKHIIGMDKIDLSVTHDDTLIDPGNTVVDEVRKLTVKDYATLCALYMPKVSVEKRGDEVARLSKMIENYKEKYFEIQFDGSLKQFGMNKNYAAEIDDVSQAKFARYINTDENYHVNINIDGNHYVFQELDKEGNLINSYEGEALKKDNFILLKNCGMKATVHPLSDDYGKEVFSDAYLFNCGMPTYKDDGSMSPSLASPVLAFSNGSIFTDCEKIICQHDLYIE